MNARFLLPVLILANLAHAQSDAYSRIRSAYATYLNPQDPLSLPMKIRSLAEDEYKFWRGSKDLFFQWAKQNCQDWMSDPKLFLPNHGDLHLGNIGSYVTEDGLNTLGFGMVDFDDSARLPFQLELLQGVITLDLVIRQNQITLSRDQLNQLHDKLFESYRYAVNSQRNARDLLKSDPTVQQLLSKTTQKSYSDELKKYTKNGRFRSVVGKKGKVSDLLDPVDPSRWDEFAHAILQAVQNDDRLQKLMPDASSASIRSSIRDVVRRTRLGSSGSQGLEKYFVLLHKPFVGIDHDIILYLKQEIPTAAERSGIIPPDPRAPGQRCSQDMDKMTDPRAFINSWTTLGGKSFWVHFKEPWSDEIDFENVKNFDQLLEMAHVWGTVVGATHRDEGRYELILPRLTPELRQQILQRSDAYQSYQQAAFTAFKTSPEVTEAVSQTDQILSQRKLED
jgi:uncharacterized protein (DUF2252 family)